MRESGKMSKGARKTWLSTIANGARALLRALTEDLYGYDVEVTSIDRRRNDRFHDGAVTEINVPQGVSTTARILDVSSEGARVWSREALPLGRRVSCRISFARASERLGMRVLWEARRQHGYEYGMRYAPIVPGTEGLLDNYFHHVLNRLAVSA